MSRSNNSLFGRFYGEGEGAGGDGKPPVTPPVDQPKEVEFTPEQQAKVNALLAENKRGLQSKLAETQKELDAAKKAGMNVTALQAKVKELSDSLMTKEEVAKQEAETLKMTFEQQLKEATEGVGTWKSRYEESIFEKELSKAAVKHNAFDADQLAVLLQRNSQVVETTDKEGKGTGKFKVITKVEIDGKELTLPIEEAVGKLRESGRYPNQFKVNGPSGTGLTLNNSPNAIDTAPGEVPRDMGQFMSYWNKLPANVRRG